MPDIEARKTSRRTRAIAFVARATESAAEVAVGARTREIDGLRPGIGHQRRQASRAVPYGLQLKRIVTGRHVGIFAQRRAPSGERPPRLNRGGRSWRRNVVENQFLQFRALVPYEPRFQID